MNLQKDKDINNNKVSPSNKRAARKLILKEKNKSLFAQAYEKDYYVLKAVMIMDKYIPSGGLVTIREEYLEKIVEARRDKAYKPP